MPREIRRRTRKNDPANTRSKVLDAAADLFHRRGYADTAMHDIMSAAGVTSGALHHHYPTKRELGLAVIRERVAPMVDEAWIDPITAAPTVGKGVTKAFKGIIDGLSEGSIIGCPLNNLALELANAEPDFRSALQEIFDRWHEVLSRRIKSSGLGRRGGGMTADELATLVIASYSGAMTLAKTGQSARPLKATLKLLTPMLTPSAAPA